MCQYNVNVVIYIEFQVTESEGMKANTFDMGMETTFYVVLNTYIYDNNMRVYIRM